MLFLSWKPRSRRNAMAMSLSFLRTTSFGYCIREKGRHIDQGSKLCYLSQLRKTCKRCVASTILLDYELIQNQWTLYVDQWGFLIYPTWSWRILACST
ncbi:hypothetical protein BDV24DRAFT_146379 [Aspergillus arachidicola]|uniref:Uncharacterized protein n=1 Tax=Aspergillus arachidicola TaxID=656916 RepID=A0A5N6XLF9_9EURO|nr:hypothetical protein BDV24DRAFT_146379 [Aspergillus arachidicola]